MSAIPALRLRGRTSAMPIVRYFIVMGAVLVGFLSLADAQLPPPGAPPNSTTWNGLASAPPRERSSVPTLTVMPALAPDMSSPAVLAAAPPSTALAAVATPEPAATPSVTSSTPVAKTAVAKAEAPRKKPKRVVHSRAWRNDYAYANPWGWRNQTRTW